MRLGHGRIMALGALVAATACSDGTGPESGRARFDAKRVQDGVATIERVNADPVLASFRQLTGQLPGAAATTGPASTRLVDAVRNLANLVAPEGGPQLIPVIRTAMLGRTFGYDPATRTYRVIEGRTGAPANGVRFVLYEAGDGGQPDPAKEIGYADLTDEQAASATSAGLKLKVVSGQVTHLEYSFDVSGSLAAATVRVVGFVSDGAERVDFNLTTTGQLFGRGGTVTIEGRIAVPSQSFTIDAKLTGEAGVENGPGRIELTVRAGADVLVLAATTGPSAIDAKITVNGALFATVTGTSANPVIKGEGGRELTADELAALGRIVEFAQGVFQLIGGLLAPAGALLLLGLGL